MESLKITIFQAYLFWENIEKNLSNLALKIEQHRPTTDLILLPEMFNTAFTTSVEKCSEGMDGSTVQWMKTIASKQQAVVAGSLIIKEKEHYYNRFMWVRPDGSYTYYDKRHLFGLGKENQFFTPGSERVIVDFKGWKICLQVCYDLRFPVFVRNVDYAYDMLIYVASWPDKRIAHWRTLLQARSIENQCVTIGVNRVGYDGNQVYHPGCSMCVGADGNMLYYKPEDEDIFTMSLSPDELLKTRDHLKFLADADQFTLHLD